MTLGLGWEEDKVKIWLAPIIHFVSFNNSFILIFVYVGHIIDVVHVFTPDFLSWTPFVHVKLQLSPRRVIAEFDGIFCYGYIHVNIVWVDFMFKVDDKAYCYFCYYCYYCCMWIEFVTNKKSVITKIIDMFVYVYVFFFIYLIISLLQIYLNT